MLAPGVEVFTPYGATESLLVASIGSAEVLGDTRAKTNEGAGVCVGRPVEGVTVSIVEISDVPIASWNDAKRLKTGAIEIAVHGPTTTREYFARPPATASAKIVTDEGVISHRMGDLGYFDEQGRLWDCGRKSHRVITSGATRIHPCENIFNTYTEVYRTALVGVPAGGREAPCALRRARRGFPGRRQGEGPRGVARDWAKFAQTAGIRYVVSPCISSGYPTQREDLPGAARGVGGEGVVKALVTGGGGFLGGVVRQLLARGDQEPEPRSK